MNSCTIAIAVSAILLAVFVTSRRQTNTFMITDSEMETAIRDAFLRPLCGVVVVASPTGSGKTTIGKHVANNLLEEGKIGNVMWFDGHLNTNLYGVDWFLKTTGMDLVYFVQQAKKYYSVEKPLILVIDIVSGTRLHTKQKEVIRYLAEAAQFCKKFNVVIFIDDSAAAREMSSWNGYTKIVAHDMRGCKWSCKHISKFYQQLTFPKKRELNKTQLGWACKAGTFSAVLDDPGTVDFIKLCKQWCLLEPLSQHNDCFKTCEM